MAAFIPLLVTLSASDPVAASTAASAGALGIRPVVLNAYKAAATRAPSIVPGCKIGWWVPAAFGKVESSHGGTSQVAPDGTMIPPIFGVPVVLADGTLDRAEGLMQFLASTWALEGIRAASDGNAPDSQNLYDATLSAVAKLCRDAGALDMSDPNADLTPVAVTYNCGSTSPACMTASADYAVEVASWVRYYAHFETDSTGNVFTAGLYALPVDPSLLTDKMLAEPHHDHPSLDLPVPSGTPVFAVEGGLIDLTTDPACGQGFRLMADSGDLWTYCHASELDVKQGDWVSTGQQVMLSGSSGEGVTGPHLHIQIVDPMTGLYCPGPIFALWLKGIPLAPTQLERTDCVG
jgi:hypothetical protein